MDTPSLDAPDLPQSKLSKPTKFCFPRKRSQEQKGSPVADLLPAGTRHLAGPAAPAPSATTGSNAGRAAAAARQRKSGCPPLNARPQLKPIALQPAPLRSPGPPHRLRRAWAGRAPATPHLNPAEVIQNGGRRAAPAAASPHRAGVSFPGGRRFSPPRWGGGAAAAAAGREEEEEAEAEPRGPERPGRSPAPVPPAKPASAPAARCSAAPRRVRRGGGRHGRPCASRRRRSAGGGCAASPPLNPPLLRGHRRARWTARRSRQPPPSRPAAAAGRVGHGPARGERRRAALPR